MTNEESKETCSCCCCGCECSCCCDAEPDQIATFLRGIADALEEAFGE